MRRALILVLLLSVQLYGQNYKKTVSLVDEYPYWDVLGVRVSKQPALDGWSVCHFFKCALTYKTIRFLGGPPRQSAYFAVFTAVLWEIFADGLQQKIIFEPDPKGADIADVFFDILGIYSTRALESILRLEKVNVAFSGRGLDIFIYL